MAPIITLLSKWTSFLRALFPWITPKKETKLNNFYTPNELKEKLKDRSFQLKMVDWVETTLRPLEDDAMYLLVSRDRPTAIRPIDTITIEAVLERLESYIALGTPAHELGHHIFDAFGGSAIISNDPFIAKGYRNDIDAAFFGAMFHDNSTGVQHRYVDSEWDLSHAELAAWIFYHASAGLIHEPVRRLAAYAIASHAHMLKPMSTKNGAERRPWNDKLFFYGERPVRLAVWVTRWTDRLENGGDAATHLPRHALATVDGARIGGMDLHGVDWYKFEDQLKYLFTPKAFVAEIPITKDGQSAVVKIPTMLQHLKGYATSATAFPYSPYNQHDHRSPNMVKLMAWKLNSSAKLIDAVTSTMGTPDFELFVKLMKLKSGYPNNQMTAETIEMVRDLWNLNTSEDQAHWALGFEMALSHYYEWLSELQHAISQATDPTIKAFRPLVGKLVDRATRI